MIIYRVEIWCDHKDCTRIERDTHAFDRRKLSIVNQRLAELSTQLIRNLTHEGWTATSANEHYCPEHEVE